MNSNVPLSLKRKVYNQCVLPVLTYGSEYWHFTKERERKLRSAKKKRGMKRKMLRVTWRNRKQATWIREQTKIVDILTTIRMKKGFWAGHIMHKTDKRWTKRVKGWQLRNCNRSQGRQTEGQVPR